MGSVKRMEIPLIKVCQGEKDFEGFKCSGKSLLDPTPLPQVIAGAPCQHFGSTLLVVMSSFSLFLSPLYFSG